MSRLSGRTISALKTAGIKEPDKKTIGELLRVPNLGIKAVTEIAERIYGSFHAGEINWHEFNDPPPPEKKCSHRVPVSQHCPKCNADAELRT